MDLRLKKEVMNKIDSASNRMPFITLQLQYYCNNSSAQIGPLQFLMAIEWWKQKQQVDLIQLTEENGRKCHFLLVESFSKAFFWLLNDPAWLIYRPIKAHHLVLPIYAISTQSDRPKSRKWLKSSFLRVLTHFDVRQYTKSQWYT